MLADFTFHPVGHGLFHSGAINTLEKGGSPFAFVYDCGGRSAKGRFKVFWDQLKAKLPDGRLTLLVISHFHKDHISGIPSLLKTSNPRMVVLPYLYPEEKIAYVAALLSQTCILASKRDLSMFILGPRNYCTNESDSRVVFVKRDNVASDLDADLDFETRRGAGELLFSKSSILKSCGNAVTVQNGASGIVAQWEFRFFMPKTAQNCDEIKKWMDDAGIKGEWLDEECNLEEVYEKIKRKFRDPRLKLSQNVSNLVCVHGPRLSAHEKCVCVITRGGLSRLGHVVVHQGENIVCCMMPPCVSPKQVLTGDAEFDKATDFSIGMTSSDRDQVVLFQVPHHGSWHNQKDWFASELPNCHVWVVPHGRDGRDKKNTFEINEPHIGRVYYVKEELGVRVKI